MIWIPRSGHAQYQGSSLSKNFGKTFPIFLFPVIFGKFLIFLFPAKIGKFFPIFPAIFPKLLLTIYLSFQLNFQSLFFSLKQQNSSQKWPETLKNGKFLVFPPKFCIFLFFLLLFQSQKVSKVLSKKFWKLSILSLSSKNWKGLSSSFRKLEIFPGNISFGNLSLLP